MILVALFTAYFSLYIYYRSAGLIMRFSNATHPHPEKRALGTSVAYNWGGYYNTHFGPWRGRYDNFPKDPWKYRYVKYVFKPLMVVESVVQSMVDILRYHSGIESI